MSSFRQALSCVMFWIGALMALSSTPAAADVVPAAWKPFSHVSFRHHMDDALSFGTSIAQDREGFIWLGTQTGLVRWDGFRARRYRADPEQEGSLPDGFILSVHVDAGGRLWVGTSAGGLARYDAARDRFATIPAGPGGLDHARISSIVDDGAGGIWVGTGAGLEHVDAGGKAHGAASGAPQLAAPALPSGGVDVLLRDRLGGLWIGTREGLFYRSGDDARPEVVHLGATARTEPSISALYQDNAGRVWIGTRANGAFVIDAPGAAPRPIVEQSAQATLQGERVCSIVEKEADVIWLGTESGGIVEVDMQQDTTRRLRYRGDVQDSLRSEEIAAMLRERGGQVFVATGGPLSQHDPRAHGVATVRAIGTITGLNIYHMLTRPDGKVWLSVPGGSVSIVTPLTGAVTELKAGANGKPGALPKGRVLAMANAPDGSVYIGTQQGLYHSDGNGGAIRRVEIAGRRPESAVWALAWQDDVLWLGGLDGVWAARLPPAGPATVLRHEDEALGDRRVTALLPLEDGTVWVGTRRGVARLGRDNQTVERLPTDNADRTRAPNGFVSSFLVDRKGRLWVSSFGNGIAFLDHTDGTGRRWFRRLTTADGLPDNSVNVLVQDRTGQVWLSTDRGLASVNPDTLQVRRLGEADGVHIPTYWSSSGALGPAGEVLFGGVSGLSVIFPDRLDTRRPLPPLAVTQLTLGGRTARPPAPGLAAADFAALTMTPADRERGFTVEFAALDYMPAEHRHYAYRLEGFDSAWIDADPAVRRASYNNLPPGTYRLRVRATDGAGDAAALALPVRVLPAWYQQTWAHMLGAFGVLAALAALVQARTSLLRRRQRELEEVVASRTAELRATQLRLETMAYNDALTDLPNRRRFNDELQRLDALARRRGDSFALLLIDLDRFKHINDMLGHDAGDALLVATAERLRAAVRQTDCVARLGGDEFAVLLTPANDAIVGDVAQRIVDSMRAPITFGPHVMHVSASIGAALAWQDGVAPEGLYKKADTALYRAKEAGRDTWRMDATGILPTEGAAA
jgi:diguanylate cyclase (GGDEF)-like protein